VRNDVLVDEGVEAWGSQPESASIDTRSPANARYLPASIDDPETSGTWHAYLSDLAKAPL
jgi:hypothetical protein